MAKVLPYVQSPLEQLNPYIQQAASGIGGALQNRAVNKRTQSILSQLENPELSQIQQATLTSQLPKEHADQFLAARKIQAYENANAQKTQAAQEAAIQKQQQADAEKKQKIENKVNAVKIVRENNKYSGPLAWAFPGTEAHTGRESLDTAGLLLGEGAIAGVVGKVGSDFRAKLGIEKLAPSSKLTKSQNEARLRAIEVWEGLPSDLSQEKTESIVSRGLKEIQDADKKAPKEKKHTLENIWK